MEIEESGGRGKGEQYSARHVAIRVQVLRESGNFENSTFFKGVVGKLFRNYAPLMFLKFLQQILSKSNS